MEFVRKQIVAKDQRAVLVLLHGYGSNEDDLLGLAPELASGITTVCLRAPRRLPQGGFAWFDIDWSPTGKRLHIDQGVVARDALLPVLSSIRDEFAVETLTLGGFSQGAMMAFALARTDSSLFSSLCLLSGLSLPELGQGALDGMPTLIQHGIHDDILPIEGGRQLRDAATEAGAAVSYFEYPMGHQICLESLRDLNDWLALRR